MHQSPAKLLLEYLNRNNITPQNFAKISGMPLTEVMGIIEGKLPVTILRANHLAAVFDTDPKIWLNGKNKSVQKLTAAAKE